MRLGTMAALLPCLISTLARADGPEKVLVAARVGDSGPASDRAAVAKQGQAITLYAVVVVRQGRARHFVTRAPGLLLGGRRVPAADLIAPEAAGLEGTLRWSTVEPVPSHTDQDNQPYSNAELGQKNHGAWKGFDKVSYFETPLGEPEGGSTGFAGRGGVAPLKDGAWTRVGSARPPRPTDDTWGGLGTMRYKVELRGGGVVLASPGVETADQYGLGPTVMRVTVRRDDSFLGWLTTYFLVPEIFGSAGQGKNNQTDRYVGADCADVLVGALRASGARVPYTSAAGLIALARHVAGPFLADDKGVLTAQGDQTGIPIQPGDLVLIRYAGQWATGTGRAWDHVGALWEDRGVKGVLDGEDLIVHMGHPHLVIERLAEQSPAVFEVLRWDPKKTR